MVRMREGYDEQWLSDLLPRFQGLDCPGTVAYSIGVDLGLREGNWTVSIVADFRDEASFLAYDTDEAHGLLKAELAKNAEQVARVQFQL